MSVYLKTKGDKSSLLYAVCNVKYTQQTPTMLICKFKKAWQASIAYILKFRTDMFDACHVYFDLQTGKAGIDCLYFEKQYIDSRRSSHRYYHLIYI